MRKFGTKQIVPLCIAAVCAVFLKVGLDKFGFWDAKKLSPTAAFVPTIICAVLLLICVITVLTTLKDDGKAKYHKEEFLVIGAAVAVILCSYLLGMLPTLGLFVILWLKLVEKTTWKTVIIIVVFLAVLVIGVFVLWLGVRFPNGALINAIIN